MKGEAMKGEAMKGEAMKVELGKEYIDPISGYKGVAVNRIEYLYGCVRISLQGKVNADGKRPDPEYFDEPQLLLMEPSTIPEGKKAGERPDPPDRSNPPER